jgi:hypothetical protein
VNLDGVALEAQHSGQVVTQKRVAAAPQVRARVGIDAGMLEQNGPAIAAARRTVAWLLGGGAQLPPEDALNQVLVVVRPVGRGTGHARGQSSAAARQVAARPEDKSTASNAIPSFHHDMLYSA